MIENDKKWQSVIMRENDKKWLIMTQKGPKIRFKTDDILRYELFNLQNAQKCKKSKVWPTDRPTDRPTQCLVESRARD